jgi:exocyst complex component 4
LHSYVTTDADVYQFNVAPAAGSNKQDGKREKLFQFSNADAKSVQITTEFQDIENIIRSAVPGLISGGRKQADTKKGTAQRAEGALERQGSRRVPNNVTYDGKGGSPSQKSLVEPSVFNMSLLLPPTLSFLQRLKNIVPPGSDLATSTLTSFLDNFLVNVFLPQLEETLTKLSDGVFEESDSFQQDAQWSNVSRRPVFRGTTAFYALITAFCRMLDKMPHDQALSQLIISQMITYYDRCYGWFKSLVSRLDDSGTSSLKLSASLAEGPGDIHDTMQKLWVADGDLQPLLEKEIGLLILQTSENPLLADNIIRDRETISSLCVLYTSMKWLAIKLEKLRYITRTDINSTRAAMQKPANRRWTLSNESKDDGDQLPVYLPMTQETVG